MLYITTRNSRDAFTAQRALRENRGPDGGMYLPFRTPVFSPEELDALAAMTFGQRVAVVLNRLFQTRLTGFDVDFSIGRKPVRLAPLKHRIVVAEMWHNPGWTFRTMAQELAALLLHEQVQPEGWLDMGIRIAVLFGLFGELRNSDTGAADLAMVCGDLSAPVSAYYARQWGLPIGNIICCCNENSELWSLLYHGQLHTDSISTRTIIPEADIALPEQLERLIFEAGGAAEVESYLTVCRRGGVYAPSDAMLTKLRSGLSVSVVSSSRIMDTIPSVYRTHNYVFAPDGALSYAGLMDYRAKTGKTGTAVVLTEKSPICAAEITSSALGITPDTLRNLI